MSSNLSGGVVLDLIIDYIASLRKPAYLSKSQGVVIEINEGGAFGEVGAAAVGEPPVFEAHSRCEVTEASLVEEHRRKSMRPINSY